MRRTVSSALTLLLLIHTGWAHAAEQGKATEAKPAAEKPKDSAEKPKDSAEKPKDSAKAAPKPSERSETKATAERSESKLTPERTEAKPTSKPAEKPAAKSEAPKSEAPGSLPAVDATAEAQELDPRRGRGSRNVEASKPSEAPRAEAETKAKPQPKERTKPAKSSATKGKRTEPDAAQRRLIAQGPTNDDLSAGKDDSELRSLREAELVLFPQPLPGFEPGWSWDLPKPVAPPLAELNAGTPPASRASVVPKEPVATAEWLRGLSMPNLPVRMEERVQRYLAFYRDTPSGRSIARVWARKSGRYALALKSELAKAGLPTDLAWLALIESGYSPTIVSPAGAAGLWQFMPDAGRAYGLTIDRWVDERLDPERATEAACRFLGDLYRRFGSWDLAMAAYNMGHGGLSRSIRKYNTNDFWELARYEASLPWETTLYVPKVLATAIMMANKRTFGLNDIEPDAPERFDTVLVAGGVPLEDIARLSGVPSATLESLNPQYLAGRTPPVAVAAAARSWPVRVPVGKGERVREALAREGPLDERFVPYVVRTGDTVESIAFARGATEAQIRALNSIEPRESLVPGTVLLVPHVEAVRDNAAADNVVVVPPREFEYPGRRRVFYRVVSGDSLGRVAEAFNVSQGDLLLWNALDDSARLHVGLLLQVFVAKDRDLGKVRYIAESKARILVAGSPEFFDYFEGQNGKRRFVLRAKSGDTLAAIGKRYGTTTASMERINRRSRTDTLSAGEAVVVYTERTRPVPGDELYVDARGRAASPRSDSGSGIAAAAVAGED
ncbi:MAG: LysM peptidoglycan-binding domain-containing protein [Myxococcota bacterium]